MQSLYCQISCEATHSYLLELPINIPMFWTNLTRTKTSIKIPSKVSLTASLLAGADLNARNFHIVGCVAIIQTCMLPIIPVGVPIHIFNVIAVPVGGVIVSVRRNNRALTSTLLLHPPAKGVHYSQRRVWQNPCRVHVLPGWKAQSAYRRRLATVHSLGQFPTTCCTRRWYFRWERRPVLTWGSQLCYDKPKRGHRHFLVSEMILERKITSMM